MAEYLDHLEVGPAAGARASVIWLHGLGADGHDFEPLVPMLGLDEGVRFVFPHAPARPVTINGGYVMPAWYDIVTLEESSERESADDILASAAQIEALVRRENERGVPSHRVVLAGFSQGGALALHVGARWPERLAGLMILSAYLVLPDRLAREASTVNRSTSLLFCHGRYDDVVPLPRGRRAFEALQALEPERSAEWHDYPMGHEVCPDEILVIGRWLAATLDAPA